MRRPTRRTVLGPRRGYKLIDLIVTVAVIALLLSLIVPALTCSRISARRTECLNDLKNLSLAMHNYATTNAGRLPGHGTWSEDGEPLHSWVVDLLPYLDQPGIADRWDHEARSDSKTPSADSDLSNSALADHTIKVLRCASGDSDLRLHFVLNAGFANRRNTAPHDFDQLNIDWNQDGTVDDADHAIARDSGVAWRTVADRVGGWGLDDFYDGAGNTILISESLHSGTEGWASPNPDSCAFVYAVDPSSKSIGTPKPDPRENVTINGYGSKSKRKPMLSSNHPGQIQIVTAEGDARGLSEDIDSDVLRRLVTPRGTPHDEGPMDSEF